MELTNYIKKYNISGLSIDKLNELLSAGENINEVDIGTLIVEYKGQQKIINCISKYFTNNEDGKKINLGSSASNSRITCYKVRNALLNNESNHNSCALCWLEAIKKYNSSELMLLNKR